MLGEIPQTNSGGNFPFVIPFDNEQELGDALIAQKTKFADPTFRPYENGYSINITAATITEYDLPEACKISHKV
jgi:hypothetical protein